MSPATGVVSWRVRYRIDGRQLSRTFTGPHGEVGARKFAELVDRLGAAEAERILDARLAASAGPDVPTVAAWCEHHVSALTGVGKDTRKRYRAYIANDLGLLAELPLDAVTDIDIAAWVNAQEDDGVKGKTIRNKHGFVYAAFERAVGKYISSNPCHGTRLPRSEEEDMVFLTRTELRSLLRFIPERWRPLVSFLFYSGVRWSEATALRVGDVDLKAGTVSIVRAWKDTDNGRVLGPPKTKKSRRRIAIGRVTIAELRPLMKGRPANAYLFVNTRGEYVKHRTFHENVWAPAVRLANGLPAQRDGGKRIALRRNPDGTEITPAKIPLGKFPRIHDARHSCASWLLAKRVPINLVQAHLGHESITTTVDRYGHLMPDAIETVQAALEDDDHDLRTVRLAPLDDDADGEDEAA